MLSALCLFNCSPEEIAALDPFWMSPPFYHKDFSQTHGRLLVLHVLFTTADKRSQLGNRQVVDLLYPLVKIDSCGWRVIRPNDRPNDRVIAEITTFPSIPYTTIFDSVTFQTCVGEMAGSFGKMIMSSKYTTTNSFRNSRGFLKRRVMLLGRCI